ncbi:MAG: Holliday junction branch migration protein RuvA [Nevskiales bacterium]
MIGRLSGKILEKQPPQLLVDVNGVGYEVEAPMSTFYKLPNIGQTVSLFAHLVVREDAQILYAFATREERTLFRELIKVSGVGPKIALAVLSGISAADFALAVGSGDVVQLTRLPGIGKKTAERLIVEMRDRVAGQLPGSPGAEFGIGAEREAYAAMLALGYRPAESQKLLHAVTKPGLTREQLIRAALQAALRK